MWKLSNDLECGSAVREPLSVSALRQSVCLVAAGLLGKEAGNQTALRDIKKKKKERKAHNALRLASNAAKAEGKGN